MPDKPRYYITTAIAYPNGPPHIGYGSSDTFRVFYGESIENVLGFLDGKPLLVMNPEVLK